MTMSDQRPSTLSYIHTLFEAGTLGGLTDAQLLKHFAARRDWASEAAFALIVERHGPMVLRVCRSILADHHSAEDAFQATFLVLAQKAGSLRSRDNLSPWLYQVAYRVASCARLAASRRRKHELGAAAQKVALAYEDASEDVGPIVHAEVNALPERYRSVIVLCCMNGRSHAEAARQLGCPIGTVQSRLARGRERLRYRLARRGLVPSSVLLTASSTETVLPEALANSTARLASLLIAGHIDRAGAIAAGVHLLWTKVIGEMVMTKVRLSLIAVVAGFALAAIAFTVQPWGVAGPAAADVEIKLPEPAPEGEPGPANETGAVGATDAEPEPEEPAQPASPAPRPLFDAVELTVVDAKTDKPLVGATVLNRIDFREDDLTTDSQGRVRVPRSTGLTRDRVAVDVWKDGYVQQRFSWGQNHEDGPIPERFTVRLLPGEVTFGGLVTDEQGKPIPGVLVKIWGYLKQKKEPHELCYMVRSTTDAGGRWRNGNLREMTFINLYLSHPDFLIDGNRHPRKFGSPSDRDKPPSPDLDRLRKQTDVQVMTRGVELQGRVLDDQGRPIVDAEVGWIEDAQQFDQDIPKTRSDVQGHFHFAHARSGKLTVLAKAKGYSPGLEVVKTGPKVEPVELRLKPGRMLQGRVVDLNGKPVEGAFINVDTWRGYRCLGVYLQSDRDGRFRWTRLPWMTSS